MAENLDLSLVLDKDKDVEITSNGQNILSGIGEAFSKAVTDVTKNIKFPDNLGDAVQDGLKKVDLKDIGSRAVETALKVGLKSVGVKTTTFNSVKGVVNAIQKCDLKSGLSNGLNLAVDLLPVPSVAKTLIKDSKNLILDTAFQDELKTVMKKQENTISRINKKCEKMEKAFTENDTTTLDKTYKTLKTDLEKVLPIQEVITKGNAMINRYELYKNKGSTELTDAEKELCEKLA